MTLGPLELLQLGIDIPFMLLLNDIRQGAFYAMLMSFWVIFAGEHIMVCIKVAVFSWIIGLFVFWKLFFWSKLVNRELSNI